MTPQEALRARFEVSMSVALCFVKDAAGVYTNWETELAWAAYQAGTAESVNILIQQAAWSPAPHTVEWGAGMMVADVALSTDETLTMYVHKFVLEEKP